MKLQRPKARGAGKLPGVQVSAIMVGVGTLFSAMLSVMFIVVSLMDLIALHGRNGIRSLSIGLACAALTYGLIRIGVGLVRGLRFAQLGGIIYGVMLLLFCWALAHDAQKPADPRAPDGQELDGPMFLLSAPTAVWLISYLSSRKVSGAFVGKG